MPLHPVIAGLRHHALTATLLTIQVACTCAIVSNIVVILANRIDRLEIATGLAEQELSIVGSTLVDADADTAATRDADLRALRAIPGVTAAAAVDLLPLGKSESSYGTCPGKAALERAIAQRSLESAGCLMPSVYSGTPGFLAAMGVRLVAGRAFTPEEFVDEPDAVGSAILSRRLAERLYPGGDALGKSIYTGAGNPIRVVGIVDTLLRPRPGRSLGEDSGDTMLWPLRPTGNSSTYLLRSPQRDRDRVLAAAVRALLEIEPDRLVPERRVRTYEQLRHDYFLRDLNMLDMLLASAAALLFVTGLGLAGLAGFWVQQRTRSIGIRRAMGARRRDILRYFQLENFLIVSFGVMLGTALALGLNALLVRWYELPAIPPAHMVAGACVLWFVGQLSVLHPALRAAAIPPSLATRAA